MSDILFVTDDFVFSDRVAGVLIRDGKILLQCLAGASDFAFPGGHVSFGETHAGALAREMCEELDVAVDVGALRMVGEITFPWKDRPCQQICLFFNMTLCDDTALRFDALAATDNIEDTDIPIEFHWVPLADLPSLSVYPAGAADLLRRSETGIVHFVYRE